MAAKGKKAAPKSKKSTPKTTKAPAKKTTTKKRAKVAPVVEPEVVEKVVEPVVEKVVEPVVEQDVSPVEQASSSLEDTVGTQLSGLLDTVSVLMSQLKTVQGDIKTLQKNYTKLLKEHDKTKNKSKRANRKPSGFAKPSALTPEMTGFLGLDKDVEMPRNEVTKLINKYIVDNDLRDQSDKRKILPDKKLGKLLGWDGKEQVSYFNLQKYIKQHFVKSEQVA
jgi:chromatin remodeling complex protein RSC6